MIGNTPSPLKWRAADSEAIELCREWMIYLGAGDTVVASADVKNVCDLYSSNFLGWVANGRANLRIDVVEQAACVASADGRRALVFVPGGVFPDAQDRADALGVSLLRYDARGGVLDGANLLGRHLRATGLAVK